MVWLCDRQHERKNEKQRQERGHKKRVNEITGEKANKWAFAKRTGFWRRWWVKGLPFFYQIKSQR